MAEELVERRKKCIECISHREHTAKLDHLKGEIIDIKANTKLDMTAFKTEMRGDGKIMWDSIKAKVPYVHFISGLTIIITAIGIVTGINWTTMTRVLDSNHRVELEVTALKAEFKSVDGRLEDLEEQVLLFRKKFLLTAQELERLRSSQIHHKDGWNFPGDKK